MATADNADLRLFDGDPIANINVLEKLAMGTTPRICVTLAAVMLLAACCGPGPSAYTETGASAPAGDLPAAADAQAWEQQEAMVAAMSRTFESLSREIASEIKKRKDQHVM